MKAVFDIKLLKMIGGGAIIFAAFIIIMPGLLAYIAGLARVIALIAMILLGAGILASVYARINTRRKKTQSQAVSEQVSAQTSTQSLEQITPQAQDQDVSI